MPSVATTGPNVRAGEKPPTLAALGRTDSPAGALVFAQFWVRALDWGFATTDSTLPRRLYSPKCSDCARFMANFDDARAKSEHFLGGRFRFSREVLADNDHRNGAQRAVDVTISVTAIRQVTEAGRVIGKSPAVPSITYRVWLGRSGAQWAVVAFKEAS